MYWMKDCYLLLNLYWSTSYQIDQIDLVDNRLREGGAYCCRINAEHEGTWQKQAFSRLGHKSVYRN